jgi:NADPH:quinone reductase-like Zn-dependent oxidoreductase/SAM-dependent methyltransferase/acyl carrier protein
MLKMCETCPAALNSNKGIMRVLEVGAGTGSSTRCIVPALMQSEEGWEFTYSDLSPAFFTAGEKIFEGSRIKVVYRVLNIEEEPMGQGFIPGHYDWIIANNVIHATKNIKATMRNLRSLLRENGFLSIVESIKPCRPTNLTFGCLEGYWLFNDFELRPYGCEISLASWSKVLQETGFGDILASPAYSNHVGNFIARASPGYKIQSHLSLSPLVGDPAWVVFSLEDQLSTYFKKKLASLGSTVITVTQCKTVSTSTTFCIKDRNNECFTLRGDVEQDFAELFNVIRTEMGCTIAGIIFLWGSGGGLAVGSNSTLCQSYLYLCKELLKNDIPKLFTVTRGAFPIQDHCLSQPSASPIVAMTKCLQNEHPDSRCRVVDLEWSSLPEKSHLTDGQLEEAFSELIVADHELYVAYRGHTRLVPRLSLATIFSSKTTTLALPTSAERFKLILPPSNAISNLRFGQVDSSSVKVLLPEEVEVRVKSYALNFRDVFVVLKPSSEFEKMNAMGIDFAGVVSRVGESVTELKVGDAVLGCNIANDEAMPSHILTFQDSVIPFPDWMTFNEAATLPAVAATAYLSLVQVANLQRGDTVLIHAGSGGVGLVAIQIAQQIGARIIATAGSERKRDYLRRLGVKWVFHSRNTSYEKEIREALGGGGVDVVLNSLTSEGFKEASLAVCNEGARFVEMSKLNVWSPEEVKGLRPDVDYTIVDLSAFNRSQLRDILISIREWIQDSRIRPIPYTRFDVTEIREALTYLQKAKHIGKVICMMPDESKGSGGGDVSQSHGRCLSNIPLFNERSTYLITGGLGGIGWEVAKWMVKSGAKHVALVGRNPPSGKIAREIEQINGRGKKNLFCLQCDIGDVEECKALLDRLKSSMELPPLRGIMHAAGVLSDGSLPNQTWEKYEKTFHPKVAGGWNLHSLTLDYNLEHFVMFSSVVAKIGSAGQSNHSSANFFLDSLSAYRNYIGLPSTTVNWGQWSGVGAAAEIEILGLQPFSPLQGISALERILRSGLSAAAVLDKVDFSLFKRLFPGVRKYFEEVKSKSSSSQQKLGVKLQNFDLFWKSFDECQDTEAKLAVLRDLVKSVIFSILKLEADFGDEDNFQDLGMDSLMMIEMKNAVQSVMGKRVTITVSALRDCQNGNQLAAKLLEMIEGPPTAAENVKDIQKEEEMLLQLADKHPELVSQFLNKEP